MAYCTTCEDLIFFEDRALTDDKGNFFCCDYCSDEFVTRQEEEDKRIILTAVAKDVILLDRVYDLLEEEELSYPLCDCDWCNGSLNMDEEESSGEDSP